VNPEKLFGFSLLLQDGDLVFDGDRLRTVSGVANLRQALSLRVQTPFGSDRFNVNYGLDFTATFTQAEPLVLVKQLITLDLVRTLGTDPRVREIRQVLFSDDPTYQARHPAAAPEELQKRRAARLWDVEVVVVTANGDTTAVGLTLGEGS
jgi:hypothetical protein